MNELVGHLYNWALSSDYVEVHILTFSDGTYTVVETSGNTANSASLYGLMLDTTNKKYYYNGNQVVAIAHTLVIVLIQVKLTLIIDFLIVKMQYIIMDLLILFKR